MGLLLTGFALWGVASLALAALWIAVVLTGRRIVHPDVLLPVTGPSPQPDVVDLTEPATPLPVSTAPTSAPVVAGS